MNNYDWRKPIANGRNHEGYGLTKLDDEPEPSRFVGATCIILAILVAGYFVWQFMR